MAPRCVDLGNFNHSGEGHERDRNHKGSLAVPAHERNTSSKEYCKMLKLMRYTDYRAKFSGYNR